MGKKEPTADMEEEQINAAELTVMNVVIRGLYGACGVAEGHRGRLRRDAAYTCAFS